MRALICLLLLVTPPIGSPVQLQDTDLVGSWRSTHDYFVYILEADHTCQRVFADMIESGHWRFIAPGRLELSLDDRSLTFQIVGYEKHVMHLKTKSGSDLWLRGIY